VPLQAIALDALEQLPAGSGTDPLFPSLRGDYFDLHNFRTRKWKPAQLAAGITPIRRIYDLRHTFATFALRAGISTFDLSRYMGASLTMIDRQYGHLARDGRDHAINLLDSRARALTRPVSTAWTSRGHFTNKPSPPQPTETAHSRRKPEALWRTRTVDPLLTIPAATSRARWAP
jgi:hypothetical protein